ncbi:hypothetical protein LMH87_003560 [Akanthomyces muscarius]|nr:hypothetical protein LMH87_003560 [Akanthomyces muscarius]KAJ4144686.1 hypothetical protein LMH87_003560 [Akanthomyces muscarius]
MTDAQDASEITVKSLVDENGADYAEDDAMDTAEDDVVHDNIEVDTSGLGIVDATTLAAAKSDKNRKAAATRGGAGSSSESPEGSGGDYAALGQQQQQQPQEGPPTPPQSNGSLGRDPTDPLTEGGVLWHLKSFEPRGTSALLEHTAAPAGFDAARLLSEDLTDLDEVELKGLGGANGSSISAMTVGADEDEQAAAKTKVNKARARRTSGRQR